MTAARSPNAASAPATTPAITNLIRANSRRLNYYTPCGMSEYTEAPPAETVASSEGPMTEGGVEPPTRPGSRKVIGPFTVRHLLVVNSLIALVALVLFAVTQPLGRSDTTKGADVASTFYRIGAETQGLEIGQRAPDLVGAGDDGRQIGLTDLDGRTLSLASFKGRPVWINFWATWCPPCQKETPDLRDAWEAHEKDGLVFVAIDVQEDTQTARDYAAKYGLTYTIGMDVTGAVFRTYRVFGLPTHYFIDRDGIVRDRVFGPLDRAGIEQKLAEIMTR